ncbi:hypothetical protein [Microcoleus sp. bin38.metabat.b11b12b14.051]|nr:hypothetical protein [Microcoleus sp. bin38.metabat.b11b12b14.051]
MPDPNPEHQKVRKLTGGETPPTDLPYLFIFPFTVLTSTPWMT